MSSRPGDEYRYGNQPEVQRRLYLMWRTIRSVMRQNLNVGARVAHDRDQREGCDDSDRDAAIAHGQPLCIPILSVIPIRSKKVRQSCQAAQRSGKWRPRTRSRPADFASNNARSAHAYSAFQSTSRNSGPVQVCQCSPSRSHRTACARRAVSPGWRAVRSEYRRGQRLQIPHRRFARPAPPVGPTRGAYGRRPAIPHPPRHGRSFR